MPLQQTDLKFLKKRKYHQLITSQTNIKFEYDFNTKSLNQTQQHQSIKPVSSPTPKFHQQEQLNEDDLSIEEQIQWTQEEFQGERIQQKQTWGYFSFSHIKQIEEEGDENMKMCSCGKLGEKLECGMKDWKEFRTGLWEEK